MATSININSSQVHVQNICRSKKYLSKQDVFVKYYTPSRNRLSNFSLVMSLTDQKLSWLGVKKKYVCFQ